MYTIIKIGFVVAAVVMIIVALVLKGRKKK